MLRKCLTIFLTLSLVASGYSQLSDLHYLPPLKQGRNNQAIQQQAVYLSTPEATPFTVHAYRGTSTSPIASFSLSNASPAAYNLPNGDNNITLVTDANTGVVLSNSGLRFEAPGGNNFYVNYRGVSSSQAASLTSKGRRAMGRNFKWGGLPNLGAHNSKSNTLGIMATEDQTTVTISDYDQACEFRLGNDRDGLTANSITVQLDANETFVLEAYLSESPAHVDGWIGAAIESDKDIVISNGGLNTGRQANNANRDAAIDQPVPENRLGKEYVFVRGNGTNATEFPLIIATQNNTAIYVNGSATPLATINEGEYFEVPGTYYSSGSAGANMLVTSSKDAYAYQSMAGDAKVYTHGLNFVAPLNCLLPDRMDHIPSITDMAGTTLTGGVTIIASTTTPDANITVTDGSGVVSLPPASPVAGTGDWKTYYLPNLTGNVSVYSTGPVAVGYYGLNGARGVAGYFSGFDTVPEVDLQITGGGCLPSAAVEVVEGTFDAYQWYDQNGPVAGATGPSYTPNYAGDFFCRVTKGPCTYDSQPIAVYYCDTDVVLEKTADYSSVYDNDEVTFTITVESLGWLPVTNLQLTDALPPGLEFVSASVTRGSFSYPNWDIGTLLPGELVTLSLRTRARLSDISIPTASYTNTATHSQDQTDTNISADSPSVSVTVSRRPITSVLSNRRITYRVGPG